MIKELVESIVERKPNRILLQLPEGLKTQALEIVTAVEKEGIEVFLSADPCYGACDLRDDEAEQLKCDLLVHVGHERFYKNFETRVPVLYYPWKMDLDIGDIDFSVIEEEKIGMLASLQYEDLLEKAASRLEKIGKKPVIGGKILGCFTGSAEEIKDKVDAFLFIGSGEFHALGIKEKKIYILDLDKKDIRLADLSLSEKKRYARIAKAKDAETFCILISSKKGQFNLEKVEEARKYLKNKDKKAFILIMDEITSEKLEGIKADIFVNTACPRIELKKTINIDDLKEVFE